MRFGRFISVVVGLAAIAATAGTASAQSRPGIWTGFYIGLNAGGGWSKAGSYDGSGFVGGGHVGYNWQASNIVLGVEADFDGATIEASRSTDLAGAVLTRKHSHDWLASIRARAGVTVGDALLYATGGFAFASADLSASATNGVVTVGIADTARASGWVAGGGAEMKFGPSWSGRIEGLHYSFDEKFDFGAFTARNSDVGVTVVRGGITYHFN